MKPSTEDMHSVMEVEDGVEPHDVFVDLGVLIVEGRIPGGAWAAGRGYGEGPHCAGVGLATPAVGGVRHDCDPDNSFLCKRAENFCKHMQLLWQNSIPMCIEVLLCPDCPCGVQKAQSPEVANIPASTDLLLEQWMITVVTKRCPEVPQISVRGLFQAVRSQLHFSQLSAWWSSSKGGKPAHVSYRVTVPGEAFASQFQRPPVEHSFPVAGVARNTAIKVLVRTLPRMEAVPLLVCSVHSGGEQQVPSSKKQELESAPVPGAMGDVAVKPGLEEPGRWGASSERGADPLLGASLLDPPQSLDLFGRRYQSPSRGSSPSMEAPERLMFGRGTTRQTGGRGMLLRWRDKSPPSPPMSSQHQRRLGRQGLARRRDTTMGSGIATVNFIEPADAQNTPTNVLPGLVDDRMQNPCTRPGKHHCRCAYDDDSETLPLGMPSSTPVVGDHRQRRTLPVDLEEQDVETSTCTSCKPPAGKKLVPQSPPCSNASKAISSLPSCSHWATECSSKMKPPSSLVTQSETSTKGTLEKKLDLVGGEKAAGNKFNLELSRREFEEVLAVLRDRNAPPKSLTQSSTKEFDVATDSSHLSFKLCCDGKSSCHPSKSNNGKPQSDMLASSKSQCDLVYIAPSTSVSAKSLNGSSYKADLLLDAILRTSGNGSDHHHSNVFKKTRINKGVTSSSVLVEKLVKCKQKRVEFMKPESSTSKSCDKCDSESDSDLKIYISSKQDKSETKSSVVDKDVECNDKRTRNDSLKVDDRVVKDRTRCCCITTSPPIVIAQEKESLFLQSIDSDDTTEGKVLQALPTNQSDPESNNNKNHDPECLSLSLPSTSSMVIQSSLTSESKEAKCRLYVPSEIIIGDITARTSTVENNVSDSITQLQSEELEQQVARGEIKSCIESVDKNNSAPPKLKIPVFNQCVVQSKDAAEKDLETGETWTPERSVPSAQDKAKFRRSLDSAASMVFHCRTGLPLTSSPAPVRRGTSCFDFDSSLNSVSAIRSALFESATVTVLDDGLSLSSDDTESEGSARSPCSPGVGLNFPTAGLPLWTCYYNLSPCSSLLGSFEESVLNGRLEPVSTVQGFTADLGASGSFCPRHLVLPVTVFFYTLGDNDKVSTPYLGHINLGKKGYSVPRSGTIQVTLFNPLGTVVKMFVVMYDLSDMPANSQTFLRQRTLYMPANPATTNGGQPDNSQKYLRYLIHLRFSSSKSGRIYLHSDIRMIIFRKSDFDTATAHGLDMSYELRSFTHGPTNPKFSPRK